MNLGINVIISKFEAKKHYEMVSNWWLKQDWPQIPVTALSQNGYVVDLEGLPLCAGWLYKTDSDFALCEWVVGNPAAPWQLRNEALDLLLDTINSEAKKEGAKLLFTSLKHERLIERYKRHGFKETDHGMTNLVRSI